MPKIQGLHINMCISFVFNSNNKDLIFVIFQPVQPANQAMQCPEFSM